MAIEALARHGHGEAVHRWLDGYADRLEERPRGIASIAADEWRDPLGDPVRTGDWLDYFDRELVAEPWQQVLSRWWPRLLPGIAAGATHGLIRVGHAVRALLDQETAPRVTELGQGLAYWAARWQPFAPPGAGPYLATDPRTALDAVPRIPDQRFGIRSRRAHLADLPGWPAVAGAVPRGEERVGNTAADEDDVPARLAGIVDAAVLRHSTHGYANPVMLVHAATAPNAVLRILPAIHRALWAASLAAAWAATAAVTAAYAPATGRHALPTTPDVNPAEAMQHAVDSAGPHAIKFADAALDAHAITSDTTLLAVSIHTTEQTGRW
ncbi:questin oxidase family protein [Micromonospora sp. LOL_024]